MSIKYALTKAGLLLLSAIALHGPVQAQGVPEITPGLRKMLGALPIADLKDQLQGMVGALGKTPCGGKLTGCYTTQAGPLHLYLFTSSQAQQTLLLVIDKQMPLPKLLKDNVQQVMGNTTLRSPILSISTTDFDLDFARMPPSLQKVVSEQYFGVGSLAFSSGVQLAARANLGGVLKTSMESLGVRADQVTMRAAVVMPIPTDLAGGAGAGAGVASAVNEGETFKKAGADAAKPEAFVEFQFAPNARLPLINPPMNLSDATFFLNNELVFGYKGNAAFKGVGDKKVLIQFQTPLTPAGGMDLLDFQFRMATPPSFTLEDAAHLMVAMATPDPRLTRYGGGFIRNIESFKKPLLDATRPLSVVQWRNPRPHVEYRFGDPAKPFPTDPQYFNVALVGPLADGGPRMSLAGQTVVLGQTMGALDASAGLAGFNGKMVEDITLKLGPLGRVTLEKMVAEAVINKDTQYVRLKGNYRGQVVEVTLRDATLSIEVPANCVNPFEIRAQAQIQPGLNLATLFDAQGGANVDPSRIGGCVGAQLEAAYQKIAGEYKNLGGYTASAATAELKKITDAARQAEEAARKAQEAARQEYERAKDAARDTASKASSAANAAFNEAGNAFKKLGKKKKHKKGPDPKFAASVFDWDFYYDTYPDLVKARVDLATHWRDSGFREGRQGSPEFSVDYYWRRYLDVQKACGKLNRDCILDHWLDKGLAVGRQGSAGFSVASYLERYSDLRDAFGPEGYEDALEHWFTEGEAGGRNGSPISAADGPVSGPVRAGGGGGGPWSDKNICAGNYVTGFRVRAGRLVDSVQFRYASGRWGAVRGYQGSGPYTADVALASGEYLVRVDYRSGDLIDNLSFTTNRGRTFGPYGGGGGGSGTYTVTPGEKLGCMAGRAGSSIDQLTFSSTGLR